MANNKVYIDVVIDDKGTTKRVAVEANKLGGALDKTGKSARTADRNLKGAAQTSANGTKNFSKMAQGLSGGLVPAYATLAAQIFAVSAAFQFLKSAGDLVTLQKGQVAYSSSTGIAMRTLTNDIIAATDAQISFRDAAQAGAIGSAAGLQTTQITALGKAARDASVILGRDTTDSFNRLIRGVTKAEPELLDELGIILRLEDASKAYADSLNLNAKDLTQFQKSQAVANDVLSQAEKKYGRIIAIVDPGVNKFNQLGKAFDDIVNNIREVAVNIATPLANLFIEFPSIAYAGFLLIGKGVLTAALPALSQFQETMNGVAKSSSESFKSAQKDIENYTRTLKAASGDKGAAKALGKQGAAEAKSALAAGGITKGRKGSGVAAILGGKQLSARQLAATKKSATAMTGIYKTMDDKIRRDFIKALDDMIIAQKVASGKMIVEAERAGKGISVAFMKMKTAVIGAFSSVVSFAAKAGAFISGAFFWLQLAGLAFGAGKIAYDFFFKSNEQMDKSVSKQTMLADRLQSLNKDYEHFAEVQKVMLEDAPNALNFFKSFGDVVGSLTSGQLRLLVEQLQEVNQQGFGQFQKASATALEATTIDLKNLQETFGAGVVGSNIAQQTAFVFDKQQKALEATNSTFLEYVKNKENATEAEKDAANFLNMQINSYKNMQEAQGGTSKTGNAYLKLLNQLNTTGKVNINDLITAKDAYLDVATSIKELANISDQNKQQVGDFVRSLSGSSQESQLLKSLAKERETIQKITDDTSTDHQKRLDQIAKEEDLLTNIIKQQFDIKLATVNLQSKNLEQLRGATKGQKERLKIEQQLSKNSIEQEKLKLAIFGLEQQALVQGVDMSLQDQRLLDLNRAKLEVIKQQNIDLMRQKDIGAELEDTIKNSFESGFEKGLADIIKGKVTSLKDAVANLTTGILESIADVLAKRLTDKVVDSLFPAEDPAAKMKNALVEGGTIAANLMSNALAPGAAPVSSSSIDSMINDIASMGATTGATSISSSSIDSMINDIASMGATSETTAGTNEQGPFATLFSNLIGKKAGRDDSAARRSDPSSMPATGQGVLEEVVASSEGGASGLTRLFTSFTDNMKGLFGGNDAPFLENLGNLFGDLGTDFGSIFSTLTKDLGGLLSSLPDLLGSLFGGMGGGGAGGIFGTLATLFFANGGIAKGGFRSAAYAKGGIATQPTVGLVGEGRHNEAIVPLPDGKSIPVSMNGGGQNNNVTVNVAIDSNGQASQTEQSDGQQGANLGKAIAAAVQQELMNQRRNGGMLSPYGAA